MQNKACSAMYEQEKTDGRVSRESMTEIAAAASITIEDVKDVLVKHEQLKDFHTWLQ